jgi:NADH:ubiquinone oxidoreductase subunit F (NADH-binding)
VAKLRTDEDRALMESFLRTQVRPGAADFNLLRVPLDLNFFRNLHAVFRFPVEPMLGAGLVVYADGTDALDAAVNFTEFYRNESCGKCVPCRLGSQKLVQIGTGLLADRAAGRPPTGADAAALRADVLEITRALQLTSICGLGYVAPVPLATALAYFPADVATKPAGG